MKNNVMEKQFNCIAVKNSIQRQIYDEIKNMTTNELLQYFNNGIKSKSRKKVTKAKNIRIKTPVLQGI